MSLLQPSSWDDSSSEEEDEWDEDEDIAVLIFLHIEKNKWPKCGGFVVGREVIHRKKDGHNRLMIDYFCANLMYPERY